MQNDSDHHVKSDFNKLCTLRVSSQQIVGFQKCEGLRIRTVRVDTHFSGVVVDYKAEKLKIGLQVIQAACIINF